MEKIRKYNILMIERVIIKKLPSIFRKLWFYGRKVQCPCCSKTFRKFMVSGITVLRPNAICPACGSRERHRLLWLYLKKKTNFFKDKLKVFDVAPMHFFQEKCKKLSNIDYISVDISSPLAMKQMDITDITFPDNEFDCLICYHVLEHIAEDKKAIKELHRILKPGGWAIIQVPIDSSLDKTFEDKSIVTSVDREKVFGNSEHVRIYGRDYKNRLEESGFTVRIEDFVNQQMELDIKKYGLIDECIFMCEKQK